MRFLLGEYASGWILVAGEELDDDALQRWIGQAQGYVATLPPK
jgi:hypothetical protein